MMKECLKCGIVFTETLAGWCMKCEKELSEKRTEQQMEQKAKYELKHDLANALHSFKIFNTGYTSRTNDAIVVEHKGKTFILNFELSELDLGGAVDELSNRIK